MFADNLQYEKWPLRAGSVDVPQSVRIASVHVSDDMVLTAGYVYGYEYDGSCHVLAIAKSTKDARVYAKAFAVAYGCKYMHPNGATIQYDGKRDPRSVGLWFIYTDRFMSRLGDLRSYVAIPVDRLPSHIRRDLECALERKDDATYIRSAVNLPRPSADVHIRIRSADNFITVPVEYQ